MLTPYNCALMIVDVQGKLSTLMVQPEHLIQQLEILIRGAQLLKLPLLWLEQCPDKLGPTRQELQALMPDLAPLVKDTFSGLGTEAVESQLQAVGRPVILLAGIESHVCVYQSARDLLAKGYQVELISDAISARTEANLQVGLKRMMQLGARLNSVECALFEIQRQARGDTFRALSQLVR